MVRTTVLGWIPRLFILVGAFLSGSAQCRAEADYFKRQLQALDVIKTTADSICYTIEQSGGAFQGSLSGTARAQLSDAISSVKSFNLQGPGQFKTLEYHGVEQDALASALSTSQSCKWAVFDRLVVLMVPSIQATGLPIEKSVHLNPRKSWNRPSIDCNQTNEPLEDLLCADDDLATWDGRMGQLYRQQRQRLDPVSSEMLRQQQRAWIQLRDTTCNYDKQASYSVDALAPAKPCILQMTKQRVFALSR